MVNTCSVSECFLVAPRSLLGMKLCLAGDLGAAGSPRTPLVPDAVAREEQGMRALWYTCVHVCVCACGRFCEPVYAHAYVRAHECMFRRLHQAVIARRFMVP